MCECFVGNLPLNLIFSLSVALAISVFLSIPFRLGDVVKKKEKARKREWGRKSENYMNCRTQQLYNPGLEARLCFPLTVCKWSWCKMMLATILHKYRECSTIKFEIKPFVTTSLQGVVSRLSRDLSGNVLFESLYCLYVYMCAHCTNNNLYSTSNSA